MDPRIRQASLALPQWGMLVVGCSGGGAGESDGVGCKAPCGAIIVSSVQVVPRLFTDLFFSIFARGALGRTGYPRKRQYEVQSTIVQ